MEKLIQDHFKIAPGPFEIDRETFWNWSRTILKLIEKHFEIDQGTF